MHELPELPLPIRYREEVLEVLLEHGVAPRPSTQPRLVYSFLRALMTLEIRERKVRRRELEAVLGPQPLDAYARQIEELRARYHLLRRLPRDWIDSAS